MATDLLKDQNLLKLSRLVTNVDSKLSAVTKNDHNYQILALVRQNNQIFFRFIDSSGEVILKIISWFSDNGKCINDICFDGSGAWLLVFCYDNTLHILPALAICNKNVQVEEIFALNEITSYVVPFIGPHECPHPKTCPNNPLQQLSQDSSILTEGTLTEDDKKTTNKNYQMSSKISQNFGEGAQQPPTTEELEDNQAIETDSKTSTPLDSQLFESSMESLACPYPTCCTWWKTLGGEHRAILGYSDGSICVVALTPGCPYLGNSTCERGSIDKLVICQDNSMETITLMINTSTKEQWKLLLEQKSIRYTFPGDITPSACLALDMKIDMNERLDTTDEWQIVYNLPTDDKDEFEKLDNESVSSGKLSNMDDGNVPKLFFPAAKARLMSLRDLGAKKIGSLKMKLAAKAKEKEKVQEPTMIELPGITPEILTTPAGPYFIVQYMDNKYLLSALHTYSDTLSVHSMDISLIPLYVYKIPPKCKTTVLTKNALYILQSGNSNNNGAMDQVSTTATECSLSIDCNIESSQDSDDEQQILTVISSELSTMKIGDDCDFNEHAVLGIFNFQDEKIINIHRMIHLKDDEKETSESSILNENNDVRPSFMTSNVSNYAEMQKGLKIDKKYESPTDFQVLSNNFPRVQFEKCYIVTNKNLYCVELDDKPHSMFLKMAHKAMWPLCEDFCSAFQLPLPACIEFAGDVLLKRRKITEALMTYNVARLPPIKTALKLAMFSEVNALMRLCSMALKNSFIIDSKFMMHNVMTILIEEAPLGNIDYDVLLSLAVKRDLKPENTGKPTSDFSYENDEIGSDLQISNSAQFHLSNLMFLTLCERCVRDKNYVPLWNFIVSNTKYHTSLSSIVLSQSGLYSSAVLLAMIRGSCLDVFSCLVGTGEHIYDIEPEIKVFMYNLSSDIFMESIVYLQNYAIDYFEFIRKHLDRFDGIVLERLLKQLNPFSAIYRPVMCKLHHSPMSNAEESSEKKFLYFCKMLIETYLILLIKIEMSKQHQNNYLNSLNLFRIRHEEKPMTINLRQFSPLATGFSHAGCVINGMAYIWGCNGVNCALSRNILQSDPMESTNIPHRLEFLADLELEVVSIYCGRMHTLMLTNNGVYAMGANQLGQLGLGKHLLGALQPMLIQSLDGKVITHVAAGQYHNAVVADGILYTWGWGVYGQLGHGSIEDVAEPTVVKFFLDKIIHQIALGHAHTLVLCKESTSPRLNSLYVFGSNHYGQLGTGNSDKNMMKSLVPVRLHFDENISLISTKFFCNLVLTESDRLYIWGSSPQALRLQTQAKKRAKSSQRKKNNANITNVSEEKPTENVEVAQSDDTKAQVVIETVQEPIQDEKPATPPPPITKDVPEIVIHEAAIENEKKVIENEEPKPIEENTDHLYPTVVDTSLVMEDIIQIATGLYHFALVTTQNHVYTWGKNIERQLGREGGRTEVVIPTKLDTVSNILYVECGSDFTLVMMDNFAVKSFGNNNMGQCGKEINLDKTGVPGKLVRLPISNRLVRIPDSSQFIELPYEINLPINEHNYNESVRYIKNLPKFKRSFVVKSNLTGVEYEENENISNSAQSISTYCDEDEDLSYSKSNSSQALIGSENDFIHYCLFIFHGLYDQNTILKYTSPGSEYHIRMLMLNYNYLDAFKLSLDQLSAGDGLENEALKLFEYFTKDANVIPMDTDNVKYFIYELFMYFMKKSLNLDGIEAYFLNNLDFYLVQLSIILYFNNNSTNNNENSEMEKKIFDKFNNNNCNTNNPILSAILQRNSQKNPTVNCRLENAGVILKLLSTKFNVIVCQKLIDYFDDFK